MSAERLDWRAIKGQVSLETVAVALLGEPSGRRGGSGLWWLCPFHADRNPSLQINPERGRWKCWAGCGHGDAVELAMRLNPSMAFPEAVRLVAELSGTIPVSGGTGKVVQRFTPAATAAVRPVAKPSGLPLENALNLVVEAAERLWTPQGSEALSYLHGRGLSDETIRSARLGYVESAMVPTRDGDRSYRVSGVVVPWFDGDRLTLVKIRQPEGREPKYAEAFRDGPKVFPSLGSIRPGRPLVAVEGEFDALLLGQELADMASVVTLGSASGRLDASVLGAILSASPWFVAHDADAAGDGAAASWPARAIRVRPPEGFKDWTELHATGFNRVRYVWGRYLHMSTPWEELASQRWGSTGDEPEDPEAEAVAERAAIQAESGSPFVPPSLSSGEWLREFNRLIGRPDRPDCTH